MKPPIPLPAWLAPLRKWFAAPVFADDEEKTARARVISLLGLYFAVALLAAALLMVPLIEQRRLENWAVLAALLLVFAVSRTFLLRGRLFLASMLMIASGWGLFLGMAALGDGIFSPALFAVMAATIVIGLLTEPRAGRIFLLLSLLAGLGLALLQQTGARLPGVFDFSPLAAWAVFALVLGFLYYLIHLVVHEQQAALARARAENEARRQAEQTLSASQKTLRDSEELFRTLTENSLAGIYLIQDGRITYANQALAQISGYSVAELIGASPLMIVDPADHALVIESMRRRVEGEIDAIHYEFRGRTKGGAIKTVEVWGSRVMMEGRPAILGNILDITERKRAEEQLQILKISVDIAPDGAYWMDMQGDFVYVNDAGCRALGYTREELLGMNVAQVNPHATPARWAQVMQMLKERPSLVNESLHRRKDGSEFPVELTSTYLQFGGREYCHGFARDITERKRAEAALRDSEQAARRYSEQLQMVHHIGATIAAGLDLEQQLQALYEQCCQIGDAHTFYVATFDEGSGEFAFRYYIKDGVRREVAPRNINDNIGLSGYVIRQRKTLYLPESAQIPKGFPTLIRQPGAVIHAYLGVPLLINDRVVGVLSLQSHKPDAYTPEQIQTLELLATQVAIAIRNSQLYEQVQRERDLADAMLVNMPGALCLCDVNGRLVRWNPYMEQISELGPLELAGLRLLSLVDDQERPRLKQLVDQVVQGGALATEVSVVAGHSRTETPFYVTGARVQIGGETFVLVMGLDISERHQIQQALREAEEQFRAVVQSANDAIVSVNDQMNITSWNPGAEKLFGYRAEEMVGCSVMEIVPHQHRATRGQAMLRMLAAGQKFAAGRVVEGAGLCKDGSEVPIEMSFAEWRTPTGRNITAIVRNITERKQRDHEQQVIANLSAAMRTAPTLAEMLPIIAEQSARLLQADAVTVEIIDPASGESVVEAALGDWHALLGARQAPGTGLNAVILRTGQPYLAADLAEEPDAIYPEALRGSIRGCAGLPLIAQEKLIGFLWIGRKKTILQGEMRLLNTIADITANAIRRATLHEQTRHDAAELARTYESTLEGWARTLQLRDRETEQHAQNVVELTLRLARAFGLDEAQLVHIRRGAILHDIGKMGVPDAILRKPGPLTDEEWAVMRQHPQYAYDLLEPIEYLHPVLEIPYCHHEKWDGSGYPRGLKGEAIPLAARIFAVVDVWDALRSDRPYRPAWSEAQALEYIRGQSGSGFDPQVVDLFLLLMEELNERG